MGKFLRQGGDALSEYVRHTAWLNAAPDAPESKDSNPPPSISRREALEAEEIEPEMPPIEWGEYLLSYLWAVGPSMAGGMGPAPLTCSELQSWQGQMGIQLQPWESQLLRRLSKDYVAESGRATERNCPPPFGDSSNAEQLRQAELNRQLDAFLA